MIITVSQCDVIAMMEFNRDDIREIIIDFTNNNINAYTYDYYTHPHKFVASYNLTRKRLKALETAINAWDGAS